MWQHARRRRLGVNSLPSQAESIGGRPGASHDTTTTSPNLIVIVFGLVILFIVYVAFGMRTFRPLFSTEDKIRRKNVRRILRSMDANEVEYFPCLDDVEDTDLAAFLREHRKRTRNPSYTSLSCAPVHCFRAVFDGHQHLLNLENHDQMASEISSILQSIIVPKEPGTTSAIQSSLHRQKTYTVADTLTNVNFGQLHIDYFENDDYVYTAILYDDPPEVLIGGETAFANAPIGFQSLSSDPKDRIVINEGSSMPPLELLSGWIVEPKKGRLVLFTAGGENAHAPLQVIQGERPTHHLWFNCG